MIFKKPHIDHKGSMNKRQSSGAKFLLQKRLHAPSVINLNTVLVKYMLTTVMKSPISSLISKFFVIMIVLVNG